MPPIKRKHRLNKAEKILILMANEYFKDEAKAGLDPLRRTAREHVAKCLSFAPSTIQSVVREWKARGDAAFDDASDSSEEPPTVIYEVEIRSFVRQCNLRMEPCTSKKVQEHLQDVTGKPVSARTVRRWLKRLRLRFIKGKKRNHYAESAGVVFLRVEYLANKAMNATRHANPQKPEVFLDESYINEHHTTEKTWLDQGEDRISQSGRGPRLVIIAAGVIYMKNNRICGEWVDGSLQCWQADRKNDHEDYHGNFDAPTFEKWFTKLCKTLSEKYGPSRIHMDRASYHCRCLNPAPTMSWKKADIIDWLWDREVYNEDRLTKKQLLELAEVYREVKRLAACEIARENGGHEVLYTPPYHPELQPIELMWARVRNILAAEPSVPMSQLKLRLLDDFRAIGSREWTNAYRHAQSFEERYREEHAGAEAAALAQATDDEAMEPAQADESDVMAPNSGDPTASVAEESDDEEQEDSTPETAPIDLLEDYDEMIDGQWVHVWTI